MGIYTYIIWYRLIFYSWHSIYLMQQSFFQWADFLTFFFFDIFKVFLDDSAVVRCGCWNDDWCFWFGLVWKFLLWLCFNILYDKVLIILNIVWAKLLLAWVQQKMSWGTFQTFTTSCKILANFTSFYNFIKWFRFDIFLLISF